MPVADGTIHVLNNGRAPFNKKGDFVTRKQVEDFVAAYVDERAIAIVEYHMAQVPGLVAHMIGEILHANGMTLKAPESWSNIPAVAPTTESQSGDAAAPEAP